jgi:outer membrane receptor for ferrienterochelin and colicins
MKRFLVVVFLFVTGYVQAQDSLKSHALDEVIVTGQYEPQSVTKSVYQVRTISGERILAKGATNLQDVLNTELNFRFSQDLSLGTSAVTLNGLSGQYVKVLIDGVPVIGKQGTENEINLNQINVNTIERIEIVEGPMSVAYGADAMAGVINIITKKAHEQKLLLSAKVQEETVSKEYGTKQGIHNQNIAAGYSWKNIYTNVEAGRNYFGGWIGNATGRTKQWYPKTQWLGSGTIGLKKENFNLYYRLDALNETISNPGAFQGGQALDQKYITNRFMHQVQSELKLSTRLSYNGAVAFTDYSRKTQSVNVDEKTGKETLSLGDGQQDVTIFTGLTARGTFQYKVSDKLSIQPGYDINVESGKGGRLKEGNHVIRDYAGFVSLEYLPVKFISIRPGVRVVKNSQYNAPPFIPSLNTKIKITEKLDLRASYGRGFRAPSLRELYFNFFDASHSIEGNPDLKAELSHSFNTSLTWQILKTDNVNLQHAVSGFYNSITNMINTGFRPGNTTVTTYINIDHFKSKGIVLNSKLKYKQLNATAGFSYTGRYNEFNNDDNSLPAFEWSPEVNATTSYSFKKTGITTSLYFKYTGKLPYYEVATVDQKDVIRLAQIGSFQWMDFTAQKSLLKYLSLTLGVHNLFNVVNVSNTSMNTSGAHSTGGPRPVGYGRSYFLALNFQLTK